MELINIIKNNELFRKDYLNLRLIHDKKNLSKKGQVDQIYYYQ